MVPTVGRIVHYYEPDYFVSGEQKLPEPQAAIVTRVHTVDVVNLSVIGDRQGQARHMTSVQRSDVPEFGRWSWPPRVE